MRFSRFFLCAACSLLPVVVRSQTTPAAGSDAVIRAESRVVLVDAMTEDKKGNFPGDLTAKDFRIWEDGKEQKISSFSLESSGVSPERSSKHYIVMLFDTNNSSLLSVRQQATRFVDGFASPDRYMAVLSYNVNAGVSVGQNFTSDGALVKKAIEAVPSAMGNPPNSLDFLNSVRNVARSLGSIRGRKALVIFGAGLPVDASGREEIDRVIGALNQANVAVYSAGGLATAATAQATSGRGARAGRGGDSDSIVPEGMNLQTSLMSTGAALAEGSGGLAFIGTNDLTSELGGVAQEQDRYYLLGYTPSVESAEGTCHNLTVKVDRDLTVRARKEYCTTKPADVLTGKPAGAALEARAAGTAAGSMTSKMQLPWFYSAPNIARVHVALDINPSGMKFVKEKGKLHGAFSLAGVAYKQDGSIAARVSDAVNLDFLTQQQVDAFLATPYHYENQFEIAPGDYNFRMAFSSDAAAANAFGKIEMPLKIEPWNGQTLSASGLALSPQGRPAADLTAGVDATLLEGLRPLVAGKVEVVPSGNTTFHAGEPAVLYLEAYEPLLAALKGDDPLPLVGLRVRVLDRATGEAKSDSGMKAVTGFMHRGNPIMPIVIGLPITNLPAGSYKLEIGVMRQGGEAVVRSTDFDMN